MTTFNGIVKLVSCVAVLALVFGGVSADDTDPVLSYVSTVQNGDIDGSGVIDITDPLLLADHLWVGGPPPVPAECQIVSAYNPNFAYIYGPTDLQNGDVNADTLLDMSDFTGLVAWLFAGGAPPVPFTCDAPGSSSSSN